MRMQRVLAITAVAVGVAGMVLTGCGDDDTETGGAGTDVVTTAPSSITSTSTTTGGSVTFTLTIANHEDSPTPLAPGLVLLHADGDGEGTLFVPGEPDPGDGLESLAEDGDPTALAAAVGAETFQAEEGGYEAGPLLPGKSFVIEITASPGEHLTFANMFGQSNDWFFATEPGGIALFDDDGDPVTGDVTDAVAVWDAGTEIDQPIGEGADQAPRQATKDTGADDPDPTVRRVRDAAPAISVTIEPAP